MAELTERQQRILEFIRSAVAERGYPPSVREIGEAVGLSSPASVHGQLERLQRAGLIERDPTTPRAMRLTGAADPDLAASAPLGRGEPGLHAIDGGLARRTVGRDAADSPGEGDAGRVAGEQPVRAVRPVDADRHDADPPDDGQQAASLEPSRTVPLVGEVAAGAPVLADERVEAHYALPHTLVGSGEVFLLSVRGESMTGDGILPGDLVAVRAQPEVAAGEIAAVLVDDEATVKRVERRADGTLALVASNPAYEPIVLDATSDVAVLGKVTAVLRRL